MHPDLPPIELKTARLALRRGHPTDFQAIHEIYSYPEVATMVASWPVPADPDRTIKVCKPMPEAEGIAGPILLAGRIIGNVGCHQDETGTFGLGYGLHPDHWGNGYATEVGRAMIDTIFSRYDTDTITAGVWFDNPGSARVLEKLGFAETGLSRAFCLGRRAELDHRDFTLTRDAWRAATA